MSIYTEFGYANRKEYLESLADQYDVDIETVMALANTLGPEEDFDMLISEIECLSCF